MAEQVSPGTPGAAAPTSPQAGEGAAASPPAASASGDSGGRNWEKDYGELEGRYKRYADLGDPDQLSQSLTWARQVAQAIQEGKLVPPSSAPQRQEAPQADPYEKWDELTPREQAAIMRAELARDLSGTVKGEAETVRKQFEDFQRQQALQMQLAIQSLRLSQESGVPFDELVAEATRLAGATPQQLLQEALAAKVGPKKAEQERERIRQELLAEMKQQKENEAIDSLGGRRRVPGFLRLVQQADDKKTPMQRKNESTEKLLRDIAKMKAERAARSA